MGVDSNPNIEKVGIPRVLEALQANDWTAAATTGDFNFDDESLVEDDDPNLESGFFEGDEADFEGLKKAIWEASKEREDAADGGPSEDKTKYDTGKDEDKEGDITEEDVQKLEEMMGRLRAVREMGEGMPEAERRRMAARAVAEAMKEL
jgi:alpha/gamma adaptin binding protein p34